MTVALGPGFRGNYVGCLRLLRMRPGGGEAKLSAVMVCVWFELVIEARVAPGLGWPRALRSGV